VKTPVVGSIVPDASKLVPAQPWLIKAVPDWVMSTQPLNRLSNSQRPVMSISPRTGALVASHRTLSAHNVLHLMLPPLAGRYFRHDAAVNAFDALDAEDHGLFMHRYMSALVVRSAYR